MGERLKVIRAPLTNTVMDIEKMRNLVPST